MRSKMLERHKKALQEANNKAVEVGWFSSARYAPDEARGRKGGMPVATVASWLDLGTMKMPARPFFRETYMEEIPNMRRLSIKLSKAVLTGSLTSYQMLQQLGLYMEGKVIDKIKTQQFAPLSDSYFNWKLKFHANPQILIDTGTLWQTLSSKVV